MRDAPVEGYCCGPWEQRRRSFPGSYEENARDKRTNVRVKQVQHKIIDTDRSDFSLILVPFRTQTDELQQTSKICPANLVFRYSQHLTHVRG